MKQLVMVSWVLLLTVHVLTFSLRIGIAQNTGQSELTIPKTVDFSIDGKGSAKQWNRTKWIIIPQRETTKRMSKNKAPVPTYSKPSVKLNTMAKVLYSDTGIYFLFQCEDRILQATMHEDFKELWWEDVVEIFLWPDESEPIYFEYQLSPLNHVRMTRHKKGSFPKQFVSLGKNHHTLHKTSVKGGEKESQASINQWTAEIYIPFSILQTAQNIFPEPGTRWRVNLYRFDYDTGDRTRWEWQPVNGANHDIKKFGTFHFK